jgi:hypothetical protein
MREWINLITEATRRHTVAPPHIASREPTPVGEFLFHGCALCYAVGIVRDNEIHTGADWRGEGDRVALTRSYKVAHSFGEAGDFDMYPVVFVLDWPALARDYKMYPHQDVDCNGEFWPNDHSEDGTEQEEALYGTISPLDRYLVSINIAPELLQQALADDDHGHWCQEERGTCRSLAHYRQIIQKMMAHPKLNKFGS